MSDSAYRAWAAISGKYAADLALSFRDRWKFVGSGLDSHYRCSVHGCAWWPSTLSECSKCEREVYSLARREEWRLRMREHVLHSDLPFSEPEPDAL